MAVLYKTAAGYCLLFILINIPTVVKAQQHLLSLQALIDSAFQYYPSIKEKRALQQSAESNVISIKKFFLPSAIAADELIAGTDNSLPGSYLSFGVIPSTSGGIRSESNYHTAMGNIAVLYGQYDLVDFGYKNASIINAQSFATLAMADVKKEKILFTMAIGKTIHLT